MKQVQLIHCPDDYCTDMRESRWYPPLNLVAIGTYLQQEGISCEILDGQLMTTEEIIAKISAPLVGISFTCISSHNLDRIAKAAKEKGAQVVVGGQAATPLARQLLENNSDIDGVIMYEGELAMAMLTTNAPRSFVPNFCYRKSTDQLIIPGFKDIGHFLLKTAPIPNRALAGVHLKKHLSLYQKDARSLHLPYKTITSAYTKRDCPKRAAGNPCSFCSRIDVKSSCYSVSKAWKEYHYLAKLGIECVGDYSDDFIFAGWLKKYATYCDAHGSPGPALRIYACVESMTDENVALLKNIGVKTVLLGIESGDKNVLAQNGKYYTSRDVIRAAEKLGKAGILLSDAYVLGLIGENKKSLRETIAMSGRIRGVCETEISYWNICTPLPGSVVWQLLMQDPAMENKFGHTYHLDTAQLEKEFVERFTSVPYEYLKYLKSEQARMSRIFSTEFTQE